MSCSIPQGEPSKWLHVVHEVMTGGQFGTFLTYFCFSEKYSQLFSYPKPAGGTIGYKFAFYSQLPFLPSPLIYIANMLVYVCRKTLSK